VSLVVQEAEGTGLQPSSCYCNGRFGSVSDFTGLIALVRFVPPSGRTMRRRSTSALCQFQTLALGDEKVSKAIVLKSGLGPGQKHNLTAESAEIDAGVDVARGRERQTVDNYGMDGAVAK
jgi:hypothetical protein